MHQVRHIQCYEICFSHIKLLCTFAIRQCTLKSSSWNVESKCTCVYMCSCTVYARVVQMRRMKAVTFRTEYFWISIRPVWRKVFSKQVRMKVGDPIVYYVYARQCMALFYSLLFFTTVHIPKLPALSIYNRRINRLHMRRMQHTHTHTQNSSCSTLVFVHANLYGNFSKRQGKENE